MKEIQVLVGVGLLYIAPKGTDFPAVDDTPGDFAAAWHCLGETQDGVTVTGSESIEHIFVDQRTGPVKAVRTEEGMTVETNLALASVENLEHIFGNEAAEQAATSEVIGKIELPLHKGFTVTEYALLFRGTFSPADEDDGGPYNAQFELPRTHLSGDTAMAFQKGDNVQLPFTAEVLEDLDADPGDEFGQLVVMSAAKV